MDGFKNIKGIIWDMDGTLYRYDDLFKTACNQAAARTAVQVRPEYTYEYAYEQCVKSEEDHGFSLYWFHQETKMTFDSLHFVYHDQLDEKIIARNEEMIKSLEVLEKPSVLLTNASQRWAGRVIAHLGMDHIFAKDNTLALEDFAFQPKGRSVAGFELAQEKLGLSAQDILVVEDLPRNLIKAKEAGMKTALVHHGKIPVNTDGADYLFQDALEVARALV